MKRGLIIAVIIFLAFTLIFFGYFQLVGKTIFSDKGNEKTMGPTAGEQACMLQCMGCSSPGVGCTGKQEECMSQCSLKIPEMTEEEKCVDECAKQGCGEYDFECQNKNQDKCDKECGMIGEPEAKNEEEQCIRDCVNSHASGTICKPSQEGEQGNDVCQMCAQQCVHLYNGPCLDDEKLKAKQKECETCEHCYGEPIMGDSGEGWECITDVECKDATSEFGDDPGTGPGIGQEGFIAKIGDKIENAIDAVGDFFSGLFSKDSKENVEENKEPESNEPQKSSAPSTPEPSGE